MGSRHQTVPTSLSMKFLVVLALLALAMAEPEADAQLLYHTGYPYYNYNGYNAYHPYNYGYAGYPHAYHSYGKREAEAEPEADPALVYSANTLPLTTGLHHSPLVSAAVQTPLVYNSAVQAPLVYKTIPVSEKTEKVSTPALVYTSNTLPLTTGVHQPLVYNVVKTGVKTPLVYNTPLVNTVYKTAAVSTGVHQPIVYNSNTLPLTTAVHQPLVYNSAVQQPVVYKTPVLSNVFPSLKTLPTQPIVYNTAVHTPLLKTVDNAVVPAVGGYIHSSHVGVCTNNLGIRVPC